MRHSTTSEHIEQQLAQASQYKIAAIVRVCCAKEMSA